MLRVTDALVQALAKWPDLKVSVEPDEANPEADDLQITDGHQIVHVVVPRQPAVEIWAYDGNAELTMIAKLPGADWSMVEQVIETLL